MTLAINPDVEAIRRRVLTTVHDHWKLFLFQGILMLILGMLAVALPNISTLEIELLVGWLLIVGGFFRAATIFGKRHMPGFWWSLLSAVLAVALGTILIARPLQGVITLTIVMTVFFVIEGVAAVLIALEYRRYLRNWSWTLLSGLINLVLAYLIWNGWPSTATWVIGLYVGINLIFLGVQLIMTAIAARGLRSTTG
ncbi:MAG: HdeD family acid-resistance protein [Steroidobacteraceae bacterium]|jgi:uncharacterized membrane protein HdeD (DUF308 family)